MSDILPIFRPEDYVWIKKQLPLDMMDIDEEVMRLPVLIQQAGEFTSMAIELREAAKDELEQASAEAADKFRKITTPSGKERSETRILSEIPLDPKVQEKKEKLGRARLDAGLWQSLVEAFRSKNSAIRVVADLLNSGYLTTSSIQDKRRKELRASQ